MSETQKAYRVKGTTDEVTECELCGRQELKGTVMLAPLDEDGNEEEIVYFGSSCGAKAAGWTLKIIEAKIKKVKQDQQLKEQAARLIESNKYRNARDEWISSNYGHDALSNPRKHGFRSPTAMVIAFEEATGWKP
jgi:hypothetical protein